MIHQTTVPFFEAHHGLNDVNRTIRYIVILITMKMDLTSSEVPINVKTSEGCSLVVAIPL